MSLRALWRGVTARRVRCTLCGDDRVARLGRRPAGLALAMGLREYYCRVCRRWFFLSRRLDETPEVDELGKTTDMLDQTPAQGVEARELVGLDDRFARAVARAAAPGRPVLPLDAEAAATPVRRRRRRRSHSGSGERAGVSTKRTRRR